MGVCVLFLLACTSDDPDVAHVFDCLHWTLAYVAAAVVAWLGVVDSAGVDRATVSNGRDAVAAWARGGYDLVLMDCQMPVLDGYAATREIRKREAGARIPIVALTADAMKKDEIECRQAGMDDHLAKPIDRDALARCLKLHLGLG